MIDHRSDFYVLRRRRNATSSCTEDRQTGKPRRSSAVHKQIENKWRTESAGIEKKKEEKKSVPVW